MKHLFIVGAQRSGSTYLYSLLDAHPQVVMAKPVRPEPKFFLQDDLFAKGKRFYEATYFASSSGTTRWFGEKSTSYIESPKAARRIAQFYPEAQILFILRDPVQRAWSNYRFSVEHGIEELEFGAALAAESDRLAHPTFSTSVNPYAYRQRGYYVDYIDDYLDAFPSKQLTILIFEEIVGNMAQIQALYRSMGIDSGFVPACFAEVINAVEKQGAPPSAALQDLVLGYLRPLERLEQHLGRPIHVWRHNWSALATASPK